MEDRVTSIQIKLKDYDDAKEVVAAPADAVRRQPTSRSQTWEDKQGPLLAAIGIEKGILNVLLFLIIAVAGFGILAIFSHDRRREDARHRHPQGAGRLQRRRDEDLPRLRPAARRGRRRPGHRAWAVLITININEIEKFLTQLTGQEIFDRATSTTSTRSRPTSSR